MKKVLISGYYGFGNTGDEAILSAMIASLRSEVPSIDITVVSSRPRETEERYGVKAIPRTIKSIRRVLKKTDMFISGGGGLLQDVTSARSLIYYCLQLVLARVERVPVMIYGQGMGPIRRRFSRFLTRLAVSGCDVIAVRDEGSKNLLSEIGIRRDVVVTADPALLLKPVRIPKMEEMKRPVVGFALRAWPGFDLDRIALAADEISGKLGASVVFIPFHAGRDRAVADQIASRMKEKATVVDDSKLPSEALGVIGELDVLVGMRLHSAIFAAVQGIPFVPIAYDPKVEEFSSSIGISKPIPCGDVEAGRVFSEVRELLGSSDGGGDDRTSLVDELRMRARQNAALAKELLKERRILGIRFDALEMDEAVGIIEEYIEQRKPHLVVTLNVEMMVMAHNDREFKSVLQKADLLIPDSVGIAWAGKLRARVPGIEMLEELSKISAQNGYRIYLLGSREGVAERAAAELAKRYPGLQVAGARSGYFSKEEEKKIIEEIRAVRPDILFVGLGMGKQEKWIAEHLRHLGVPASLGVGGSFDVIAGEVNRAPRWIRQAGLEWLYRFAQQPTRFKRMLALPKFVYLVIRERGLM